MATHPFDIFSIPEIEGKLIFTPCPGTKDADLRESLQQLKTAGAEVLVTLMTQDELQQFNVEALPAACHEYGLKWCHLPIEDNEAPAQDFDAGWNEHSTLINQSLEQGDWVAIHCLGGSGRTGLMASIILLERDGNVENVKAAVQTLRPRSLQKPAHIGYLSEKYSNQ